MAERRRVSTTVKCVCIQEKLTERRPAVLAQESGDLIGDTLGACEDQDLVCIILPLHDLLEVLNHLVTLLGLADNLDDLGDTMVGSQLHRTDVDLDEVGQEVGSHGANLLGPSGGPHECLTIGTDLANDLANLGLETHVQHTIGLIENQVCDAAEIGLARLEHVNETTRSSNANLNTTRQVADLRALRDTTVNAGVADARRLSELGDFLLNLDSEFTSGGENKNDRSIAGSKKGLGVDVNNRGKAVCQGLSGTGLSDTDDITSGESHGPALGLNGSRRGEALGLDLIHHVAGESGLVESLDRLGDVGSGNGHGVFLTELLNLGGATAGNVRVLLIERLLELGHGAQVPVLFLQVGTEGRHAVTTAAASVTTTSSKAAAAATRVAVRSTVRIMSAISSFRVICAMSK